MTGDEELDLLISQWSYTPVKPQIDVFWENLGAKADIVQGDLVVTSDGFLTITDSPVMYSLYVDRANGTYTPIVPKDEWRGRLYRSRRKDCVTLAAEWYDKTYGTNTIQSVKSIGINKYRELGTSGFVANIESVGFSKVDDAPQHADVLVYINNAHIGVCLEGDKILHHLPNKYSCIDSLDAGQVIGVYRYGN